VPRLSLLLLPLLAAVDGGVAAPDGGHPDAGVAARDAGVEARAPAAPERWKWVHGDGGWIADGGVSDFLTVRVGETARVQLELPIVLMQCDEPLLELDATEDTLLLTGLKPGHTMCGFWYAQRAWPHRYMDVTVTR
jgi:hypothetical protein